VHLIILLSVLASLFCLHGMCGDLTLLLIFIAAGIAIRLTVQGMLR
jgi:hypothetical protein